MPNGLTSIVRTRKIERLAKHQRGGAHGPGFITPTLDLDLELATEIGESLLANRAHDGIYEGRAERRAFTADNEQLGI